MQDLGSTKAQILLTAEQLIADRGVDGVSLRQIGAAAGAANNSAVQYHFGTKDGLVEAIFTHRLPRLHRRRTMLLADRRAGDLRGWVECQVTAVMEQSEEPGSRYLGFVAALRQDDRRDVFERIPAELRASTRAFHDRLASLLPHLPERLREHRVAHAMVLVVRAGADRELGHAHGRAMLPFTVEVADLVDGIVGFLRAPASPDALAVFDGNGLPPEIWPDLL
ncbi:TetR/AcrR family transcriptional regulator [Streptomyces sp. NPDC059627]